MTKLFIATTNPGKQQEIRTFAQRYARGIDVYFPDSSNALKVDETGSTFHENALLKARAYQVAIGDPGMLYVGDDSGISIPALGGEPGVFTRRWAGHEMTDAEIVAYCLQKMNGLTGDDRRADFRTVLALVRGDADPMYYEGSLAGHILEQPIDNVPIEGFPFRALFWVDELDRSLNDAHDLTDEQRGTFLTHREKAFKELFTNLTINQ